ncbi:PadR family transcriptional regulator [Christensenella hongkongensis]|uniref:PadR family transcriptional regulator n=1 Tax=Christensenella hongkongensis TaxID=270498 RepID=UPI002671FC3F|nr:helix-turn-helix transcriptional regulator [Christensenella hongkongensis]
MDFKKAEKRYIPMSETMFLWSRRENRNGFGIMQHVKEITNGRIRLGAGTIYQSISKLLGDGLICATGEDDRRKSYVITELGMRILTGEARRIRELYEAVEGLL